MKNTTQTSKEILSCHQLHAVSKGWISSLQFMDDELKFIENLLQSYVFEPNTPNLFERLQDYQERLQTVQRKKTELTAQIREHENNLGGVLECREEPRAAYREKHRALQIEYLLFESDFQKLKSEIFNYAGGILKKRRS